MNYKTFHQFRISEEARERYAEVKLEPNDFIYPYFVVEGCGIREEIKNLWGVYHFSIDELLKDIEKTIQVGISKILLFGVINPEEKTEFGVAAYSQNNLVEKTVRAIKRQFPSLIVITDVCLCAYTNHGHCGIVSDERIQNDETIPLLAEMAVSHARGGADIVAPSAMMDGQVQAIRQALDKNGLGKTQIMGYSAKYASGFYGPFRDAAKSAPSFGDRKTYQMDYRNKSQAIQEISADIDEGANYVMVKPAHAYLDVIHDSYMSFPAMPIVAYHVSGEYMMIKSAASQGFLDERNAMTEALTAIKRAGARLIISYYARELFLHE